MAGAAVGLGNAPVGAAPQGAAIAVAEGPAAGAADRAAKEVLVETGVRARIAGAETAFRGAEIVGIHIVIVTVTSGVATTVDAVSGAAPSPRRNSRKRMA